MSGHHILVAGIGNVFFGDDGFGVEVVRRLHERLQPEGVRVIDFGIRGLDLAYALLDGYDAAILVDATPRGGSPGTLYVIEPDASPEHDSSGSVDTHGMTPGKVLQLAHALGGPVPLLRVVGCEPLLVSAEDEMAIGLSAPVAAAVDPAVRLIESLVAELTGAVAARA